MSPVTILLAQLLPVALALWALARLGRTYPTRRMVWLAVVPGVGSLVLLITDAALWPLITADVAVVIFAAVDAVSLPRKKRFRVERQAGRIASLRQAHPVTLTVTNHDGRPHAVSIRDGVPDDLDAEPAMIDVELPAGSRATVSYRCRARRRGAYRLGEVYLRTESRSRLWQRFLEYPLATRIDVYPDMKQLSEYAVLARTNRLSLVGVRRTRRVGQDNEFERLRDFTLDDNFRHIDWRSTARRRKLTVKQFQQNQSQRLMFLVDCGRMMTNEAAGLSLLDHALNAMLMLSFVALSRGDSVGLICFSNEIHAYVPPRGGRDHMNRLLHASFDRFPQMVESRYDQAFLYLASRSRKRSLVILITNVIDEVNSNQIERHLGSLAGQHLPLGVLLRDRRVFEYAEVHQPEGEELFRAAAAAEILTWRQQVLADLNSHGVLSLDVFPEQLTAPLVNQYLEIKARQLL